MGSVSSAFTDNVSVLLNKGDGSFHDVTRYGVGIQPYAIATGDFNRDGKLDLATANSGSSFLPQCRFHLPLHGFI